MAQLTSLRAFLGLWCKEQETRWRMVDTLNSGHIAEKSMENKAARVNRTEQWRGKNSTEKEPQGSRGSPSYSSENSVHTCMWGNFLSCKGTIQKDQREQYLCIPAGLEIVPISTNQTGKPQDSQDIRQSTQKNLAPKMSPTLSIALGQNNKS